jgi:RNA methyltransferase, TrmH family
MTVQDESRLRPITSRQNGLVKELRKAFSKGEATLDGSIAIEGMRILEEAIRSGLKFQAVFFSESARSQATRLLPQIASHTETLMLPDDVFTSAVSTETPQGVAALVKWKPAKLEELLEPVNDNLLLVAVGGIQDPGNLGTIIRSAEAFAARGVLQGEKTVSPFNSKVVRASAGSIFREPVVRVKLGDAVAKLKQQGVRVVGTSSHKGKALQEASFVGPCMIVIGNEGTGLAPEILAQADELMMIRHSERVESLNAGIAASIILYEAARQRASLPRTNVDDADL